MGAVALGALQCAWRMVPSIALELTPPLSLRAGLAVHTSPAPRLTLVQVMAVRWPHAQDCPCKTLSLCSSTPRVSFLQAACSPKAAGVKVGSCVIARVSLSWHGMHLQPRTWLHAMLS